MSNSSENIWKLCLLIKSSWIGPLSSAIIKSAHPIAMTAEHEELRIMRLIKNQHWSLSEMDGITVSTVNQSDISKRCPSVSSCMWKRTDMYVEVGGNKQMNKMERKWGTNECRLCIFLCTMSRLWNFISCINFFSLIVYQYRILLCK